MGHPRVSIIASSYNTPEKYLLDCVNSMLNQTFEDFEFLIVDDCSSKNRVKDILAEIKDERIVIIENKVNLGLAASLNECIERSTGEYIVRMDTDDISMSDRLERQVKYMDAYPECDIMSGRTCLFTDSGKFWLGSTYFGDKRSVKVELFFDSTLLHPSVIIRSSFLKKNNLKYDESCRRAQDYNLWVRSSLIGGDIRSVEDYYIFYRQHENAASKKDRSEQVKVVLDIHKQYLEMIGIKWNEENKKLHECFCNPYDYTVYDVKSMLIWAKYLINQNKTACCFDDSDFTYGIIKRLLGGIQLHFAAGNIGVKELIYCGIKIACNPIWLKTAGHIFHTKKKQKENEERHYNKYIQREWEHVKKTTIGCL